MIECTFKVNTIYNGQVYLKDQTYQLSNKIAKALGFDNNRLDDEPETTVVTDNKNEAVETETENKDQKQDKEEGEQTGESKQNETVAENETPGAAEDGKQEK